VSRLGVHGLLIVIDDVSTHVGWALLPVEWWVSAKSGQPTTQSASRQARFLRATVANASG
jgi:hypothetical protein